MQIDNHIVFSLLKAFSFSFRENNVRGNSIYTSRFQTGRVYFDAVLGENSFKEFDTKKDNWYFGVWVSKEHLCTVTYAGGEITVVLCPDKEHFNEEVKECIRLFGPGEIRRTYNMINHKIVVYQQDRNDFLIQ